MKDPADNLLAQTQQQRWIRYGSNVALSLVVVVLLACALTYLAQRHSRRLDTTSARVFSLKPQTINLIRNLDQKIKLVSLYAAKDYLQKDNPYAAAVTDLLQEYARKSNNIEFDVIDPITQPTKADNLVAEAISRYGGAVKAYKDFLNGFKGEYDRLNELVSNEAAAVASIQTDGFGQDERGQMLAAVVDTIRDQIPQSLARMKERTDRSLKAKFPDYKAIVDRIRDSLASISETEAAILKFAQQVRDDPNTPQILAQYLADSNPRHEQIRQLADQIVKTIEGLGELKVGELQQAIKGQDLILVLGQNDWRVLGTEQVWITDTRDLRGFLEGRQVKPRFAGEQAITTAILSLSGGSKPKAAFVRAGGPPLTTPPFLPFQRGGPLSGLAERLRSYNFEVFEKDLTGSWQMQSRMQGMTSEAEPSDQQIKDAVWIVINMPGDSRFGPSPTMAPKLMEHLNSGGSALVMTLPQADNLAEALKDFGLELTTDALIVHEVPRGERARSSDLAEEAQRLPFVFLINQFGEHLLTRPLESLDMLLVGAVPVRINPVKDVKQTPLLPIPQNVAIWAERDIDSVQDENPKFDSAMDTPGPLWAGAAAEKGNSRLVVLGTLQSFTNQILGIPDAEMLRRQLVVARFPGNSELFANAVFWLARLEPMIAISPAAMEVSRIAPMSQAVQDAWRIGVLLIGLPGAVVAAGIAVYFSRRD